MSRHRYLADFLAIALLLLLTLLFFWKIALTNLVLAGLDVSTYFYPYKAYAAEMVRRGQLPLWNPYLFMGVPYLANIQTALFYPLNFPLYWLPSPQMVACSIALHIFLSGLFLYLFARISLGFNRFGAFLSAITFAFSGFLGAQVEHINQLNVFIWLPLLLLLFDLARRETSERGSFIFILLAGLVVGLQFTAGHVQASYVNLFALGIYAIFPALSKLMRRGKRRGEILHGLFLYAIVVAIGLGLAAVQLLPTYELSRLSIRSGGLPYRRAVSFSLNPRFLLLSLLPTFGQEVFSEYIAYVGFAPLVLALFGVIAQMTHSLALDDAPARKNGKILHLRRAGASDVGLYPLGERVRQMTRSLALNVRLYLLGERARQRDDLHRGFFVCLLLGGLLLALGGYNPFYFLLYKLVPGFDLFRAPARWLYLYTFAAAVLAGFGADSLQRGVVEYSMRRRAMKILLVSLISLLPISPLLEWPPMRTLAIWSGLAVLAIGFVLVGSAWRQRRAYLFGLGLLVIVELFAASRQLAYNRPTAPEAYSSLRPAVAHLLADEGLYRLLSVSDISYDPGDLNEIQQIFKGQMSQEQIYNYVVAAKQKEVLAPNLPLLYRLQSVDGYDGGVLPLRRYVEMQRLLLPEERISPDGRLWQRLTEIPEARLLSLFNVKYVIADKVHDVWVDGVYYDLGHTVVIGEGASSQLVLRDLPGFTTTSLGIVSYLTGSASLPDGAIVAEVMVSDELGRVERHHLRAGVTTAEGEYGRFQVQHGQARVVHHWRDNPQGNDYHAVLRLNEAMALREIVVRYLAPRGRLHLRGMSLIDERTGTSESLVVSNQFKLVHSGDVKIYENLDNLPRAFIVHRARVIEGDERAIAAMRDGAFLPGGEAILSSGKRLEAAAGGVDEVRVMSYQPERIVVEADLASEGYLVLTDAYYPGWRVRVDGHEKEIQRADYLFRAVYLPQGKHLVEFVYDPPSLKIGAAISLVTSFSLALGLGLAIAHKLRQWQIY